MDATWLVQQAAACPTPESAAETLRPLFRDLAWLEALAGDWIAPMRRESLVMPPFSATRSGSGASLVLASAPGVSLLVTRLAGAAERPDGPVNPPTIRFSGQLCLLRLLGEARVAARLALRTGDGARSRAIALRPETILTLDERRRALWIAPPRRALFLLRARIARTPAPPAYRHDLNSGARTETVQGDQGLARTAMLLGYLRAAGHRAAVPVAIALLDRTDGRERWTVMRELLALDARAAWPHLEIMAAHDPEPAVRAAARLTIERFSRTQPDSPCRA
jgi:hypothetical protein